MNFKTYALIGMVSVLGLGKAAAQENDTIPAKKVYKTLTENVFSAGFSHSVFENRGDKAGLFTSINANSSYLDAVKFGAGRTWAFQDTANMSEPAGKQFKINVSAGAGRFVYNNVYAANFNNKIGGFSRPVAVAGVGADVVLGSLEIGGSVKGIVSGKAGNPSDAAILPQGLTVIPGMNIKFNATRNFAAYADFSFPVAPKETGDMKDIDMGHYSRSEKIRTALNNGNYRVPFKNTFSVGLQGAFRVAGAEVTANVGISNAGVESVPVVFGLKVSPAPKIGHRSLIR